MLDDQFEYELVVRGCHLALKNSKQIELKS